MASLQSANKLGERLLGEHCDEMYAALIDRVTQNYADYERRMVGVYSAQDVFDAAPRIHAVSDAYSYLTVFHDFSEDELRFFLQFQNPLDMVAQHWHERNMDTGDMSFTIDFIMEPERRRRMLESYPLVRKTSAQTPEPPTLREQLYNKLSAEYDAFIADLKGKTPDKIIDSAYEKVYKEDIVSNFIYDEAYSKEFYSDEAIGALFALKNPLEKMYHYWRDTHRPYSDALIDSIFDFVAREVERQNEPDSAASEKEAFQPIVEPPQAKPKAQAASREPSLLDELYEATREVEARKADRSANPTKKYDKEID
jgi:hypothetical protein